MCEPFSPGMTVRPPTSMPCVCSPTELIAYVPCVASVCTTYLPLSSDTQKVCAWPRLTIHVGDRARGCRAKGTRVLGGDGVSQHSSPVLATCDRLRLEERELIGVDLVLMRRAHAMVEARIAFQRRDLYELGDQQG